MRDIHLNRELLRAIAKGEVEPRILVKIGLEHLRCLCPTCAAEWDAWECEKVSAVNDRLPGFLANQLRRIASEETDAAEEFRQLLAIEPERRVAKVVRSRARYRSASLVRLLIAEARRSIYADHKATFHFAELAFHVADRLTGSEVAHGLVPLCLAEMANALRVKPDTQKARELFDRSRALTQLANVSDPSVIARIDHLEAAYFLSLRRFPESEQLLDRAKILYALVGASTDIAKIDITRSLLFLESGQAIRALQTLRELLRSPAAQEEQKLYLWARINMARAFLETKDLREAKRVLDQDEFWHV